MTTKQKNSLDYALINRVETCLTFPLPALIALQENNFDVTSNGVMGGLMRGGVMGA